MRDDRSCSRAITWFFAAALSAVGNFAAHAQENLVTPSERVTRFVYVRAQPSGASPELGRLSPGESLPLVRAVPRWHEVRLDDGRLGYVSKSWTNVTPPLPAPSDEELRIHFLSIGAGTCTVVECPGANAPPMIIDCGSFPGSRGDMTLDQDRARERVQSILARHSAAPNVVLSHGDIDHYNWIPNVLSNVTAGHIWQGGLAGTYGPASGPFRTWLKNQRARGATLHQGFRPRWHNNGRPLGDALSCGLASTYVLTVNTSTKVTNASSLVLMIEHGDFTVIFSGDADGLSEEVASTNFKRAVKATVLVASHHGAETHKSNNARWVRETAPAVIIYSSGQLHGHPRCSVTARYNGVVTSAPGHQTHCNETRHYVNRQITTSNRAEYVTDVVGSMIVTSTGRSPASLRCEATVGCEASISH